MAFSSGNDPFSGNGLHRPLADINVTPLVDVMLVLLIVFMVTAPMLATGLKVDLPQIKKTDTINPKEPVVVSVTADGQYAVGTETVALEGLVDKIKALIGEDTGRIIQIRADKEANYGSVVGAIDELASNGLVHVALISNGKQPQKAATVAQ